MKEKFDAKATHLIIETRLGEIYATLSAGDPPKKIRKSFARAAKKISRDIKDYLKAEVKQEEKRKKADVKALRKKKKAPAAKSSRKKGEV